MNSAEKAIEEDREYELAKKWLTENGIFKRFEKDTRDSKSLDSTIVKTINVITFQKNNSSEIQTNEGEDIKELIINMYRSEY
ncbi:hypothetical protein OIU83_11945 [Flavobacterium sp. LS1R49]|uniref:Uncharacterized protein n=1 Tax=Flavobacterium shii TaxID=2987687 RepID=A0A9X2ZIP5_9FLAO|nr:hypothetical protein [Flavobacterium shii]MCV9928373.1 hypothetical protein [Flavobacterium shii]